MPYDIREFQDGYKVCKKVTKTCYSKNPIPLKRAIAQRKAIGMSGGEMSGGSMIIKAPKYGKIEIGIPNMYYKDKLIEALTKLKALKTRNKQKSIILEESDNPDIVIENNGEKQPEKDGIKFHTLKIKVPKTLINIKKLKKGDKEVEVPTLTEKSKNLTTRNKIRSIKFKTIEGDKVKILNNDDNVEIIHRGEEPEVSEVPKVELIKDPKNEFEEEVNKLIKFSLGHINFDEFSQELINPDIEGLNPKGGLPLSASQLFVYYLTLKYKMTLIYSGSITNTYESHITKSISSIMNFSFENNLWINTFNELPLYRGAWTNMIRIYLDVDTLKPVNLQDFNRREGKIIDFKTYIENNIQDILEKSKKQIILPITIGLKSETGGHKLLALFRPFEKKIYVIDPHGGQRVEKYKTTYEEQNKYFKKLADKIGYEFIKSEDSCPYIKGDKKKGFQSIESMLGKKMGFCGYWTYFIIELALQHPNQSLKEVYKKAADIFSDDPAKVFRTIVKYQANMSMIINEIAKDSGLNLSNAMSVFEDDISRYKLIKSGKDRLNLDKINSPFQKFMKTISDNMSRIYLLQKQKLGYGKGDISNYFFHEDLTGGSIGDMNNTFFHEDLTGKGFFDDEDWEKILNPELEGSGKKKYNMLEIFKGTGSVGKVFKNDFNVVSIDFDPIYTPDIETDILDWNYKKWYNETKFKPDFIWASPPCNTFSPLAYPLKERDPQTAEPFSERAKIGTAIAHRTVEIIKFFEKVNPNLIYIIENPKGMLRHDKIYKNLPFLNTTLYCLYKDCRYKPTDFWSNVDLQLKEPVKKNCYTKGEKKCNIVDIPLGDRYKIPAELLRQMKKKVMNHMKMKGGEYVLTTRDIPLENEDINGGAIPINKKLYEKAKEIVYPQYKKPSAYRSGAVIKKYKELGGKFKEAGERKLKRWFEEEWKDIGNKEYPVFRPTKKVSQETPLTPEEIDPENLKLQIEEKQKIKGSKNLKPFEKKGGELYAKDKYLTKEKELTPEEKKIINKKYGDGNPQIEEIKSEPMGDDDILKYFPNAKILKYSELKNYNDITQLLPKNKSFFFLLYEHAPNNGHWIAVLRYRDDDDGKDTIEYFCSYGTKIDEPLTWTSLDRRIQLGQDKPLLSMLLDKSPFKIVYNKVQYQSKKSGVATCGAYDTLRVGEMLRHNTNLREFNEMLEEVKKATGMSYDAIVSNLVSIR